MSTDDPGPLLWLAADKMRGELRVEDHAKVIMAVLLLKGASATTGVLQVPVRATWDRLVKAASGERPRAALSEALSALESANPDLFAKGYLAGRESALTDDTVRQLVDIVDRVPLEVRAAFGGPLASAFDRLVDLSARGRRDSELTTPRGVGQLLVQLVDPKPGNSVYDPCTGTGSLLVAADAYVEERTSERGRLRLFGQDVNEQSCVMARMNLIMHGLANWTVLHGDVLTDPMLVGAGGLATFDRVVADPPMSLKRTVEPGDPRQARYGHSKLADLMFVQHVLASLAPDGEAAVVVPNGVLFRGGDEGKIRRGMIDDGRIAAVVALGRNLFPGTSIPASVLVLRGEGAARASERDVLLINAEQDVEVARSGNWLAPRHVEKIARAYRERQETPYFSRVVDFDEIESNNFVLNIGDYVSLEEIRESRATASELLLGGIAAQDVEAHRGRFAAFGINLDDLLSADRSDHLRLAEPEYLVAVNRIYASTATKKGELKTAIDAFVQAFHECVDGYADSPLGKVRVQLENRFHQALAGTGFLTTESVSEIFVDWWAANVVGLDLLRRSTSSDSALRAETTAAVKLSLHAAADRLIAAETQRLVDIYRGWNDRHSASLADLDRDREALTRKLVAQLRERGHSWPSGG